jgi:hypothetical protein
VTLIHTEAAECDQLAGRRAQDSGPAAPALAVASHQILLHQLAPGPEPDAQHQLLIVQSVGAHYSVGAWLAGAVADGSAADEAPVLGQGAVQSTFEAVPNPPLLPTEDAADAFLGLLDMLADPASTAAERNDAYALVTGVRIARPLAPFCLVTVRCHWHV